MTQHLGTPPRPWAGLETHLYAVVDCPHAWNARNPQSPDLAAARRRNLATLSLALGYLARKRAAATTDAG